MVIGGGRSISVRAFGRSPQGASPMGKKHRIVVQDLEGSPSHLLHRALQLALDVYAEETGPGAVTQRQYAVLAAVAAHEGLTQTDLVRATGIDRSTLADMISRMIAKGLLDRARSEIDARANTVRLSEDGRAALERARPQVEAADARILAYLSSGKRDGFITLLKDLSKASDKALSSGEPGDKAEKGKKKKDKEAKKAKKARKAALKAAKGHEDRAHEEEAAAS
jgi:DNA-binding MarR family transcriptional regulator